MTSPRAPAAAPKDRGDLDAAAALGGQVAHDLGNVLTVVLGNAEILAETLAGQPDLAATVARIQRAAERGSRLVDRLDLFARHLAVPATPTDLSALLSGYAERLGADLPPGVVLDHEVPAGLGRVAVEPASLVLLLDELVNNALAAVGSAGRLRIHAMRRDGAGGGAKAVITIGDDGPGMTEAARRRVLAPSFASGEAAHRTGLGLALAARIAAAGGGRMALGSAAGGGTEATLTLPLDA